MRRMESLEWRGPRGTGGKMNVLPLRGPLSSQCGVSVRDEWLHRPARREEGEGRAGLGVGGMNGGPGARALARRWEGRRTEVVDIPSRRETGCWDHADPHLPCLPPSLPAARLSSINTENGDHKANI